MLSRATTSSSVYDDMSGSGVANAAAMAVINVRRTLTHRFLTSVYTHTTRKRMALAWRRWEQWLLLSRRREQQLRRVVRRAIERRLASAWRCWSAWLAQVRAEEAAEPWIEAHALLLQQRAHRHAFGIEDRLDRRAVERTFDLVAAEAVARWQPIVLPSLSRLFRGGDAQDWWGV